MNNRLFYFLILCGALFFSPLSYAYVGPGAGLSMVGSLVAVVVGVFVALIGLVLYPLKLMKKKRQDRNKQKDGK